MDRTEAVTLSEVIRELREEPTEPTTLDAIVASAVALMPACDHASITMRGKDRELTTAAGTDELVAEWDALQYKFDEGPCIDAVDHQEAYLVDDTSTDPRWPVWGPQAAARGARAIMSIRLFTNGQVLGALNMYSAEPHKFTRDELDLGVLYAAHAAMELRSVREMSGLQTALLTRHMIGIAQGILMNRYGLTQEQSFDVLRRYSSHTNTKLRDVAQAVVDGGEVPDSEAISPSAE